jgi:uncharacterized protein
MLKLSVFVATLAASLSACTTAPVVQNNQTTSISAPKAVQADTEFANAEHAASVKAWREKVETSLRRDNGWLTLAGRYIMKPGVNTFGTGADNDIVLPPEMKLALPARMGQIIVDPKIKKVTLKLDAGITMKSGDALFTGIRELSSATDKRDWVSFDRMAMHVIERDGNYILRLADNQSEVRKQFAGRIWYDVNPNYKVTAKFVPYPVGKKVAIVNVIDEVSDEPVPGYVEFSLNGKTETLDVIGDDANGLFFVLRDGTAGDTTYRPSRFLYVEKKPKANEVFELDFNRTYNPPCAFSAFTTCPLPPKQNILKTRIEAGEQVRKQS